MTQKHIFITDSDFANRDSSFEYVLWFQPSLWAMILSRSELIIFLDGRYFSKTKSMNVQAIKDKIEDKNLAVRFIQMTNLVQALWQEIGEIDTLYFQESIALRYMDDMKVLFPSIEMLAEKSYFWEKRQIKTWEEKDNIKKAIDIIDQVFLYLQSIVESWEILWKTEIQIRQIVIQKIFEFGGQGESFETIIAFWKNSAVPHHTSWNTLIENGVLLIDMGAKYNGYCSDFTRTIWVWEKTELFEKFEKAYSIVQQSHMASYEQYMHGMTGSDLDTISREIIQSSEFKDLFIHNLWHSLGIDIHEEPRLKNWDTVILKEGMVFTIEPWIYIENEFGIRLEDIVFLEGWELKKYTSITL
jgi:Xaa-Pro aminopeptidase/Xaa-Pro dipeptidase